MPLKFLASALFFALCSPVFAQENKQLAVAADTTIALSETERPQFKGGEEALQKFIKKNLEYPERARKKKIQGAVVVAFLIDEKGDCSNFKVIKSLERSCDAAAIRALQKMPPWKPAKVNNKAVATEMQMPVTFQLDNTLNIEDNKNTKNKYR